MIETFSLYDGDIELRFDSVKHQYRVLKNGRTFRVPGVTTVCGVISKPALIPWAVNSTLELVRASISPGQEYSETYLDEVFRAAKREASARKSDAAERGKIVHELLSEDRDSSGGSNPKVELAREWAKGVHADWQHIERPLYSKRHRYSGRCDAIGFVDGVFSLVDWKTGKGVYPEYRLQTAAYVLAWEEEYPDSPIEQRVIVRLGERVVEPHYYPRPLLKSDKAAFLGALSLYSRLQKIEREDRDAKKVANKLHKKTEIEV